MVWRIAVGQMAFLLGACVLACKSPPVSLLRVHYTDWKSYSLHVESSVPTGAAMLMVRQGFFMPSFAVRRALVAAGLRPLPPGVEWVARHEFHGDCGDAEFVVTHPDWYSGVIDFVINSLGVLPCEFAVLEVRRPKLFKSSGRTWSVGDLAGHPAFERLPGHSLPHKNFGQRELVFNGRSENTIFILYREFVNDLARPALYQELRYDLDDSSHITFREWEIEIIDATNEIMRFKVLRD